MKIGMLFFLSGGFLPGQPSLGGREYAGASARIVPGQWLTADHSRFPELQKEFSAGPEVTAACLSCHNEAGNQIQETIHWTWICPADSTGRMGKNGITLNNF